MSDMRRFFVLSISMSFLCSSSLAQQCADPPQAIISALKTTKDPEFVLRSAAILQRQVIQELSAKAQPGMPLVTVPGAAEVALAKLGETKALGTLRDELAGKDNESAIRKLSRVGTDKAAIVLLDYVAQNGDKAQQLVRDYGDYSFSPLSQASQAVAGMMICVPVKHDWDITEWTTWWRTKPDLEMGGPIDQGVTDSITRCNLRLADWGFPESVIDAYESGGESTLPAMKVLYGRGDKFSSYAEFGSIRGNAQTVSAKAGDHQQFDLISQELLTTGYKDAIKKLSFIGNEPAVATLVTSLTEVEKSPLRSRFQDTDFDAYVRSFRAEVLAALRVVVKERDAPDGCFISQSACIKQWQRWLTSKKAASGAQ